MIHSACTPLVSGHSFEGIHVGSPFHDFVVILLDSWNAMIHLSFRVFFELAVGQYPGHLVNIPQSTHSVGCRILTHKQLEVSPRKPEPMRKQLAGRAQMWSSSPRACGMAPGALHVAHWSHGGFSMGRMTCEGDGNCVNTMLPYVAHGFPSAMCTRHTFAISFHLPASPISINFATLPEVIGAHGGEKGLEESGHHSRRHTWPDGPYIGPT